MYRSENDRIRWVESDFDAKPLDKVSILNGMKNSLLSTSTKKQISKIKETEQYKETHKDFLKQQITETKEEEPKDVQDCEGTSGRPRRQDSEKSWVVRPEDE